MRMLSDGPAPGCERPPGSAFRVPFLLFSLILPVLLIPPAVCAAQTLDDGTQACLACHAAPGMSMTLGDGTAIPVSLNAKAFGRSVHASLGCAGCHGDIALDSHPSAAYKTKQEYQRHFAGICGNCHAADQLKTNLLHQRVIGRQDAASCTGCHGAHAISRVPARKEKITVSQYCLSCHAKPLTRSIDGKPVSLTVDEAWIRGSVHSGHVCTDCHRAYSKDVHPAPKAYATGRELTHEISETCGNCHPDKALKARDSIHAAVLAAGDQRAPGCSDCHGSHRVGPGALADTMEGVPCRKCHAQSFDDYRTSVHGMMKPTATAHPPLCAACHSAHAVKPAMASRSPKDMCLGCHSAHEKEHGQRLPNPKVHLDMVACTACHVPLTYRRSIYLRLTDAATGALLNDAELQAHLAKRGSSGQPIAPKELWQLYRDLNAAKAVNVAVAISMDVRRTAHYLAPKSFAVSRCETCHSADSSFFNAAAVVTAAGDGREVLHAVDPKVLGSAYGALLLKRFYVMSGTRLTAMDYAGVLIILGGIAVPVLHGTARFLTRRLRRGTKGPEGRGTR